MIAAWWLLWVGCGGGQPPIEGTPVVPTQPTMAPTSGAPVAATPTEATAAAAPTPSPPMPAAGAGKALQAWKELSEAGCDLQKKPFIHTYIEARILRNAPYAMRQRVFAAPDLASFFQKDGKDWYEGVPDQVIVLPAEEAACVARLQAHEEMLRTRQELKHGLEARLTSDPSVFEVLWGWGKDQATSPYGPFRSFRKDDGTIGFESPEPGCSGGDCPTRSITCAPDGGPCTPLAAG